MSHNPIQVHIWDAPWVGTAHVSHTEDTLDNDMDPELDFDLDAYDQSHRADYDSSNDDSWDEVFDGFKPHVESYYGTPDDNEVHLILVDRTFDRLGAGKASGAVGRADEWANSNAAVAGVNVGVDAYAESTNCQSGHGTDVFKNTVIHEVGHCLLHSGLDFYNAPADDCDQLPHVDHSLGGLDLYKTNDVTPMQTWYTAESCDNNSSLCDNCTNNGAHSNIDYATQKLTLCASQEMNEYNNETTF